ncbi:MAG: hypothetical protein JXK94_03535 [Deltaproteobacteria bacterium]|nr:hypothetical protein [Deltaproteobacteria bacterium]
MANIIYGVSGEGFGHSSRAREMLSHLEKSGHTVKVVSYDKGYRSLKDDFDVFETEGLHIASADNKVSMAKTLTDNMKKLPDGHKKLRALRHEGFEKFKPDCVITDFEPMTAYLANHYHIPLITIDNQHRMRYMDYPYPPKLKKERLITESVIRGMVPKPDVSLVTSFYFGEPKNNRTFIFPPILRKEVLSLEPENRGHTLVYLTSGFESFVDLLKDFTREQFVVYGYNRDEQVGNFTYKAASREGFLADLSTCKAVMATAGFTLLTESLYLRKPYLALPMRGQFEQELNGHLLEKLQYGANVRRISPETIGNFLYRLPDFSERLKGYRAEDNRAITAKLDELLLDDCAQLKKQLCK